MSVKVMVISMLIWRAGLVGNLNEIPSGIGYNNSTYMRDIVFTADGVSSLTSPTNLIATANGSNINLTWNDSNMMSQDLR